MRFKNTIYRLRRAAGKEAILFEDENIYRFDRQLDYEEDSESFVREIELVEKAARRRAKNLPLQRRDEILQRANTCRNSRKPGWSLAGSNSPAVTSTACSNWPAWKWNGASMSEARAEYSNACCT